MFPTDWYWLADDGRLFSSAKQATVADTDPGYVAWSADQTPTRWPVDASGKQTDAALQDVLTPYGIYTSSTTALLAYANAKQWALATGGYTTTIGGKSLTFGSDVTSQALITGKAVRFGQANPPTSVDWQFASGFVTIAAADFLAAAIKIADFVQSTFDTLKTVQAGVAAGTIKSTADIDAAFAV